MSNTNTETQVEKKEIKKDDTKYGRYKVERLSTGNKKQKEPPSKTEMHLVTQKNLEIMKLHEEIEDLKRAQQVMSHEEENLGMMARFKSDTKDIIIMITAIMEADAYSKKLIPGNINFTYDEVKTGNKTSAMHKIRHSISSSMYDCGCNTCVMSKGKTKWDSSYMAFQEFSIFNDQRIRLEFNKTTFMMDVNRRKDKNEKKVITLKNIKDRFQDVKVTISDSVITGKINTSTNIFFKDSMEFLAPISGEMKPVMVNYKAWLANSILTSLKAEAMMTPKKRGAKKMESYMWGVCFEKVMTELEILVTITRERNLLSFSDLTDKERIFMLSKYGNKKIYVYVHEGNMDHEKNHISLEKFDGSLEFEMWHMLLPTFYHINFYSNKPSKKIIEKELIFHKDCEIMPSYKEYFKLSAFAERSSCFVKMLTLFFPSMYINREIEWTNIHSLSEIPYDIRKNMLMNNLRYTPHNLIHLKFNYKDHNDNKNHISYKWFPDSHQMTMSEFLQSDIVTVRFFLDLLKVDKQYNDLSRWENCKIRDWNDFNNKNMDYNLDNSNEELDNTMRKLKMTLREDSNSMFSFNKYMDMKSYYNLSDCLTKMLIHLFPTLFLSGRLPWDHFHSFSEINPSIISQMKESLKINRIFPKIYIRVDKNQKDSKENHMDISKFENCMEVDIEEMFDEKFKEIMFYSDMGLDIEENYEEDIENREAQSSAPELYEEYINTNLPISTVEELHLNSMASEEMESFESKYKMLLDINNERIERSKRKLNEIKFADRDTFIATQTNPKYHITRLLDNNNLQYKFYCNTLTRFLMDRYITKLSKNNNSDLVKLQMARSSLTSSMVYNQNSTSEINSDKEEIRMMSKMEFMVIMYLMKNNEERVMSVTSWDLLVWRKMMRNSKKIFQDFVLRDSNFENMSFDSLKDAVIKLYFSENMRIFKNLLRWGLEDETNLSFYERLYVMLKHRINMECYLMTMIKENDNLQGIHTVDSNMLSTGYDKFKRDSTKTLTEYLPLRMMSEERFHPVFEDITLVEKSLYQEEEESDDINLIFHKMNIDKMMKPVD